MTEVTDKPKISKAEKERIQAQEKTILALGLLREARIQLRYLSGLTWEMFDNKTQKWKETHNYDVEQIMAQCFRDANKAYLNGIGFGKLSFCLARELAA